MSVRDQWAATEELLAREAESLGGILDRLRDRVSPVLIGNREWERLVERACDLPSTMAAYPFGFELPLHKCRPGADLGVSVFGGTGPAAFFEERGRREDADRSAFGIAWLLRETERDASPLRQVVGRNMMLEYDVESASDDARPHPGIFVRPSERPVVGDGASQRVRDIRCVLDAVTFAAGWNPAAAGRRWAERVYRAQTADTRIVSFGAFPSRERGVRLAVTGFQRSRDVVAFLERAGWQGQHSVVASVVSRFEERGDFVDLGIHFDVRAEGLGPALGLSFFAKNREPNDPHYWVDRPGQWTPFLEGLREAGLGVGEKLSAMADWPSGAEAMFCRSGMFVLLRGIHHFKIVVTEGNVEQIKGYLFMLICPLPRER